jgi:acetyl esterase/lipase
MILSSVLPALAQERHSKFRNLAYREVGERQLMLDLYVPQTPAPAMGYPSVVSIHGGAWEAGDRYDDYIFRELTRHGYVIASIDYRLSTEAKYPAQLEDARGALKWLVENSPSWHLDTNKFFAAGFSAGGHLALMLGLTQKPGDRTIKAVCALYPPTDLTTMLPENMRAESNNPVADLLGGPVSKDLALAREASPITHVRKDSIPVLLYHGDADRVVPLAQSEALSKAMKAAGAQCRLFVYPHTGHGFWLNDADLAYVAKFFEKSAKN